MDLFIYIYIYIKLPVRDIARLPHIQRGNKQGQAEGQANLC